MKMDLSAGVRPYALDAERAKALWGEERGNDWQSFLVGAHELVRFSESRTSSCRVRGAAAQLLRSAPLHCWFKPL